MKTFLALILFSFSLLVCSCHRRAQPVVIRSASIELNSDSLARLISRLTAYDRQAESVTSVSQKQTATYTLNEAGDTVSTVIERERESSLLSSQKESFYLALIDSLREKASRVDSVYVEMPVPVEVIKEVNHLHRWQKCLLFFGILSALYWIFIIGRRAYGFFSKFRK